MIELVGLTIAALILSFFADHGKTLKIPMLTFEVGFLGWKFSLLRGLFSFPIFIAIGFLMAIYLTNRKFEVKEPG